MKTVKERLIEFIGSQGLTKSDFCKSINVSPAFVSNIAKSIQPDKVERIKVAYPNLNTGWLLTGEGSMLKDSVVDYQNVAKSNPNEPNFQYGARSGVVTITPDQIKKEAHGTPVYDIDAVCGFDSRSFQDERVIGYVDLPGIRRDSHIVTASGDSMEPRILNGDKIVVREVIDRDYLFWGQIYLVLTPDYRLLKYVRKHPEKKDCIILRSENPEYEDIELPKDKIVKLFVVENILSVKNMM